MKHNWMKDRYGRIDEFAFESGFHNGVICKDCGKTVCVCCHTDYMEMDDCEGKPKPTPLTNADRIRAMSDEELTDFLEQLADDGNLKIREWLRQPADMSGEDVCSTSN
jgi:hypothetical protein